MAAARAVIRDALAEAFPGPAPECCGHVTCGSGAPTCDYVIVAMVDGTVRCQCRGVVSP